MTFLLTINFNYTIIHVFYVCIRKLYECCDLITNMTGKSFHFIMLDNNHCIKEPLKEKEIMK